MKIRLHYGSSGKSLVHRRSASGAWAPAVLACVVLAGAAGIVAVWHGGGGETALAVADSFQSYMDRIVEHRLRLPARVVYPYSVIPGGVASPEEVAEAMRKDPVVLRHYAGFDPKRARVETLRQPRLAYVSYRVRDRVYFTSKPVRLFAGEQVITDGKTTIRARCGNKVEETPQAPVSPEEPAEEVLNAPRLEPDKEKEAPLGAPLLESPKQEEEAPLAAVIPPPGFAPLDIPARPGGVWLTPPPAGGGFLPPAASGPAGPPPAAPPVVPPGPAADPPPVAPPPAAPPVTPGVSPPPATPPGTTPPSAPPGTPPTSPPGAPPAAPPVSPPSVPPGTPPSSPPGPPPVSPPATPPGTPPTVSPPESVPAVPPGTPPGTTPPSTPPGTPPTAPPVLPPPVLPPGGPPDPPGAAPPPDIVIPPPPGTLPPGAPEPPPIPEPSTYALVAAGLAALGWLRRRSRAR